MNRKQMIVLWIAVVLISMLAFIDGMDRNRPLEAFGAPIVLISGAAIYSFRTPRASSGGDAEFGRRLLMLIVALQAASVLGGAVQVSAIRSDLDDLSNAVSEVENTTRDVESSVSSIETEVESMKQDVEATHRMMIFR